MARITHLAPLHDDPGNGQGSFLVDHADHQRQALSPDLTAVYRQEQRALSGETPQQRVRKGQEVDLDIDPPIVDPAGEVFDPTLLLGSIGHLGSNGRQLGTLAPYDAADQGCQCVQVSSKVAFQFRGPELLECAFYGMIPASVVTHGMLLAL
jgi:hypothetical protein